MSRLGIIAGGGDLPRALVDNCNKIGRDVYVIGLKGFVDPWAKDVPGAEFGMGEIGKAINALTQAQCKDVVFAGNVKRPDFSALKLDIKGMKLLPKVLKAARDGDDALLRVILSEFEKNGFNVVGADDVYRDLLPSRGRLGTHGPSPEDLSDIETAARIASDIGRLDIGQGAVVCNGLVLAVEAQEGTDAMLNRCRDLPEVIRGTEANKRGVLVKRPKPIQERRIDLPTMGVSTIQLAYAAGLSGVAMEANAALLLDRDEMIKRADELGLFIYAFLANEFS